MFMLFSACTPSSQAETSSIREESSVIEESSAAEESAASALVSSEDGVLIALGGDSVQCASDAVQIQDRTVTITEEGSYILSGTLEDGMIIVDAEKTDTIQIILDGAVISHQDSAALYVRKAEHVYITTAQGSENTLSNGGTYAAIDDNNIDSVIFSKSDLTLSGTGTLTLEAAAGHGVVSKDDLIVAGGTYVIDSAQHALSGKDSIQITDGVFRLTAGSDGIHAENNDDDSLGSLYIEGGDFEITAGGDGLSAGNTLEILNGTFTITTASGGDTTSIKGIKAAQTLTIRDGSFALNCEDDALHSNGDILISGGSFRIASGDDGMHADGNLSITAGTIEITESYEGIEGQSIDISGGTITLKASDDGLNAAGGNDESGFGGFGGGFGQDMFAVDENAYIQISGGTLIIDASGDGIDSNGSITVSGGEVYVSGPVDGANGALDFASEASISGGVFIAAGSSQMAENFGASSTQASMLLTLSSQSAGTTITLTDGSGQTLVSFTAEKAFNSVVISCPELTVGETYTLSAGSYETDITLSSLIYGSGQQMGGMPGSPGSMGMGNMPGGGPRR